jgi:ABC-type dipeptide/oligopeptide/nickel transport system permease subunit/ABC-type histidine transport system ATPase subunit
VALILLFLVVAIFGSTLAPYDPARTFSVTESFPLPPSAHHLLGTTQQQQDVLSQLLVGTRSTVLVAFLAGMIATVLSVVIGVTAGYQGRLTDDVLSMVANFFLVLPALPLLIVIFGFLKTNQGGHDLLIGVVIALTGWAWGARVLRAQTLSLRNRDYVDAARISGERSWRIITFEILPNLLPIVASSFLFTVLYGVGTYTALAFLGLINPEHWSWGSMLFEAQNSDAEISGYWWWYIPPGLAVAFLGTSLALLNFGIDEFINPRLRAAGVSRRQAKKSGGHGLPRRFELGLTPVVGPGPHPPVGAGDRQHCRHQHGSLRHGHRQPDPGADVMTAEPLLEIRGLRVDYGAGPGAVHAVVDADLTLRRGEVLGLAGESGSGKSTLAYAAIRLLRAPGMITGGEVLYHPEQGRPVDLLDLDEPELRRLRWSQIAVVLQSAMNALNPVLSIGAQLTDVLQAHVADMTPPTTAGPPNCSKWSASPRTGSAATPRAVRRMRQRVMIAMALALEPRVI